MLSVSVIAKLTVSGAPGAHPSPLTGHEIATTGAFGLTTRLTVSWPLATDWFPAWSVAVSVYATAKSCSTAGAIQVAKAVPCQKSPGSCTPESCSETGWPLTTSEVEATLTTS